MNSTINTKKVNKILLRIQKYVNIDMLYVAKGGFWLTLANIAPLPFSFVLSLAYAQLSPESYGYYTYVLSLLGALSIFNLSGIDSAVVGAVTNNYDGTVSRALKTKINYGIIGSLCGLIVAAFFLNSNEPLLAYLMVVGLIFLPVINPLAIYQSFLNGKKQFAISTKYQILSKIITSATIFTTIMLTKNILIVFFVNQSIYTFTNYLFYKITIQRFAKNTQVNQDNIDFGKHLSYSSIPATIIGQIDSIILFNFLGPAALAIYSFSTFLPKQVSGLFSNVSALALPKFAVHSAQEIKKTLLNKMAKMTVATGIAASLYIICAPFLYKYLFPQYISALHLSQIFALTIVLSASELPTAMLTSLKAKKQVYQLNITSQIIKLTLTVILIPLYGLWGAIIARVIYNFIYFLMSTFLAYHYTTNNL